MHLTQMIPNVNRYRCGFVAFNGLKTFPIYREQDLKEETFSINFLLISE